MSIYTQVVNKLRQDGASGLYRSVLHRCLYHYNNTKFRKNIHELTHKVRYGNSAPSASKLIEINPSNVDYLLSPHFYSDLDTRLTHIVSGSWDNTYNGQNLMFVAAYDSNVNSRQLIKFEEYGLYNSLGDRYIDGVSWDKTEFYNWVLNKKIREETQGIYKQYSTRAKLETRLEQIDQLYHSLKENGYRKQSELEEDEFSYRNEIMINIGRNGQLILDDGRHRLLLSKIIGIQSVPVRVFVRHEKWQRIRKKVAMGEKPESVDLNHPDLQDVQS